MEGLLGLQSSIRNRQSAMDNLNIIERMDADLQQKKQQEMLAEQQQALAFEAMFQKADQFLEKDRDRINSKIKMAQEQLKESLDQYGGSRRLFMQNGGITVLNNLKNDIMRSDEAIRYENNQKNMALILQAQQSGMGDLINPNDLKSLQDYQDNPEGGKIQYTGLMNKIIIPPSDQFAWGTNIPIEDIINHDSNEMKLRMNYKQMYPERENPSRQELIRYAIQMGYGGRGSNVHMAQLRAEQEAARIRAKAEAESKAEDLSLTNELHTLFYKIPDGLTMTEINQNYNGSYIEFMKEKDPNFRQIIGGKNETKERRRAPHHYNPITRLIDDVLNDKYGLHDSYNIFEHNQQEIAQTVFSNFKVENGKIQDFIMDDKMYSADGVQLTGNNSIVSSAKKRNLQVVGIHTGWKVKPTSAKGASQLVVNAYNDDGTLDEKMTQRIHNGWKDPNNPSKEESMKPVTLIAVKDDEGRLFYREFDITQHGNRTAIQTALGENDKIGRSAHLEKESQKYLELTEKMDIKEREQARSNYKRMNEGAFKTNQNFSEEGKQFWGAGSGGSRNRDNLMKSMYMALDYTMHGGHNPKKVNELIDRNEFSLLMEYGGIKDDLRKYDKYSDSEFINMWLDNMNKDLGDNVLALKNNQKLAQKWLQLYSLIGNN